MNATAKLAAAQVADGAACGRCSLRRRNSRRITGREGARMPENSNPGVAGSRARQSYDPSLDRRILQSDPRYQAAYQAQKESLQGRQRQGDAGNPRARLCEPP
jgi:hypothetical protein